MKKPDNSLEQLTEVKLSYRNKVKASDRPNCSNSEATFRLLWAWWDQDAIELYEEFAVLLLDRRHRAIGIYRVSQGGLNGTVADVRLVFIAALKARAAGIILSHNHPSRSLQPSVADVAITHRMVQAGKLLHITVLDHLIISPEQDYYSFADADQMDGG